VNTTKLIALVIATYNRAVPLDGLLSQLENQTLPKQDWEVIVCVDGSTDNTMSVLSTWKQKKTLPIIYFWQENLGQAAARHNAILRCQASWVVIIDDDMAVCPQFLEEHQRLAESAPDNTVIIGKVVLQQDWKEKPLYEIGSLHWLLSLHEKLEQQVLAPPATSFVTQNVSLSRDLYFKVGGFDPLLRLSDDLDLGIRLERAECHFVFHPLAWAVHCSEIGSYSKWCQRQYNYGKEAVYIWEKHNRDPQLHPLRYLVMGSLARHIIINIFSPRDRFARLGIAFLRILGNILKAMGLLWLAVATYKPIATIQYYLGVKHYLGSWQAVVKSKKEFKDAINSETLLS